MREYIIINRYFENDNNNEFINLSFKNLYKDLNNN